MAGRVRHAFDVQSLERYLEKSVPEVKTPVEVKQFGFGQSNPTYQITAADGTRFVLRKKPGGKLLSQSAHQVEREHRIIKALGPTNVPVPKTFCLCEDNAVIGTPFYIMEFLQGRVFEVAHMPGVSPRERMELWRSITQTLARFHSVDYVKAGLGNYGRPNNFYDRQLATWRRVCSAQEKVVGPIPHFDEMLAFFARKNLQPKDRSTLVHGDYKVDNVMYHKSEPHIIGILDWEMSTVGHPLSDLIGLLFPFYTAGVATVFSSDDFLPGRTPGLPRPETIIRWYSEITGWDPRPEINWALAFGVFRSAAICQGIAARAANNQASSEKAALYGKNFPGLGEYAWSLIQKEEAAAKAKAEARL